MGNNTHPKWIKLTILSILYIQWKMFTHRIWHAMDKAIDTVVFRFYCLTNYGFLFYLYFVLPYLAAHAAVVLKWHLPNNLFIHQLINWCVNSLCSLFRDTNQFRWNGFVSFLFALCLLSIAMWFASESFESCDKWW